MCSAILLRNYIRLCRHENEKSASYKIDKNTIGKKPLTQYIERSSSWQKKIVSGIVTNGQEFYGPQI